MCCRYGASAKMYEQLGKYPGMPKVLKTGDIHPSEAAPVLQMSPKEHGICFREMRWGFPVDGRLLINARAESALTQPTFAENMALRRCIIPASFFYEWDADKNKFTFDLPHDQILFMAGCYRPEKDGSHFVILTTAANASMEKVHDRMPLIFPEAKMEAYLTDDHALPSLLASAPPLLNSWQEYEQLSLF